MKTIQFGDTGLTVTPIGLGLAALGRPGYINLGHGQDLEGRRSVEAMEMNAHRVLDAAWDSGIRYYDAARSYGRAEQFLGSWLASRKIRPGQVTVGSKWGYTYTAGWHVEADKHEVKEHSLAVLERQIRESRSHLSPFLKLYQIHSATEDSGVLENREVLEALGELRDDGLVVGLSLSGPNQASTLRQALRVHVGGRPLFGAVQATWNILAQEVGPALTEAHDAGLGIIVKEALANGRLTERNKEPGFRENLIELREAATSYGTTVDAIALAAVLAQPFVHCALSGATIEKHLRSNVAATELPDAGELAGRFAGFAEEPDAYWQRRSRLAWN